MKNHKNFLKVALFACLFSVFMVNNNNAQSNWEIGGRFGDVFAVDATVPIAAGPRLHPAIYFGRDLGLATYFDWMFALDKGPSGLKLYPGVGPEIYIGDDLNIGVAGNFGIEYSFDFPLTIALDWRPRFMLTNNMDFHPGNWGLIARFRIGEGVKFSKAN